MNVIDFTERRVLKTAQNATAATKLASPAERLRAAPSAADVASGILYVLRDAEPLYHAIRCWYELHAIEFERHVALDILPATNLEADHAAVVTMAQARNATGSVDETVRKIIDLDPAAVARGLVRELRRQGASKDDLRNAVTYAKDLADELRRGV